MQHTATEVIKYGDDPSEAHTEMAGMFFIGTHAPLAWRIVTTGILLLESKVPSESFMPYSKSCKRGD